MTEIEIEWFEQLAEVWPGWHGLEFTENTLAYPLMGELAYEVAAAISAGDTAPVAELLGAVEESLATDRTEIRELIVAGLFETLTTIAYRRFEPPDLLDEFLGERSLHLWRGTIEGWTAPGVRSIAELRAFNECSGRRPD